jgi:hypothetical protein
LLLYKATSIVAATLCLIFANGWPGHKEKKKQAAIVMFKRAAYGITGHVRV